MYSKKVFGVIVRPLEGVKFKLFGNFAFNTVFEIIPGN